MLKIQTANGDTHATSTTSTTATTPTTPTSKVTFALPADEVAGAVSVLGDFNGWDPLAHPLKKRSNGTRSVSVELPAGEYQFKYLAADGSWFCDPHLDDVALNDFHAANSVLRV